MAQRSNSSLGTGTTLGIAGALILLGLTRRSKSGLAIATAGGVLAFKTAKQQPSALQQTKATFLVNAPVEQAYELWRNFEGFPRFMAHLKSVRSLSDRTSEWVARGPMNRDVRWTAEITEDSPNNRIAWRSLPESEVQTSGSVEFRRDPQNRGTFVTAEVFYGGATGALAHAFGAFVGKHPEFVVREDLRRFKALLEAGETPTTVGQTHGPRGLHGHTEQVLFRETSNHPQPQAA